MTDVDMNLDLGSDTPSASGGGSIPDTRPENHTLTMEMIIGTDPLTPDTEVHDAKIERVSPGTKPANWDYWRDPGNFGDEQSRLQTTSNLIGGAYTINQRVGSHLFTPSGGTSEVWGDLVATGNMMIGFLGSIGSFLNSGGTLFFGAGTTRGTGLYLTDSALEFRLRHAGGASEDTYQITTSTGEVAVVAGYDGTNVHVWANDAWAAEDQVPTGTVEVATSAQPKWQWPDTGASMFTAQILTAKADTTKDLIQQWGQYLNTLKT